MRASNRPKIDICVPVYNAASFIDQTLQSIFDQSFTDFRVLVSVDLGQDDSVARCRKFTTDKRLKVIEQKERLGWRKNCNFLMEQVTAPFMKFAPHDDRLEPLAIERLYEFIQSKAECSIAIPSIVGVGEAPMNFDQLEVRGNVNRRMLDVILNQKEVAAFHGMLRVPEKAEDRPMIPSGIKRDFESDIYWMAQAATQGELLRVHDAIVYKHFSKDTKSQTWLPDSPEEAIEATVTMAARLVELSFTYFTTELERKELVNAAMTRLFGLSLNVGGAEIDRSDPYYRAIAVNRLFQLLEGAAGEFVRSSEPASLYTPVREQPGIILASIMAKDFQHIQQRGSREQAEELYKRALKNDPQAGWQQQMRKLIDAMN